jgi:uncharacterized protein (DUF1015 family)
MFSPFRGLLYDPARVADRGAATSPPYDVIDASEQIALTAASPFNVVRLLLSEPGDERYQHAATLLEEWRRSGILALDDGPRFYLYRMTGRRPGRPDRNAVGVLGALRLVALGDRVLPHEEIMEKHRADRMAVLRATRANLDPIIALSSAPDLAGMLEPADTPRLEFDEGTVHHCLFDIDRPEHIAAISAAISAHPIALADGHHRYTTARQYRQETSAAEGPGPWDAILTFMAPAIGSGLRIGPYHRGFGRFAINQAAWRAAFVVTETAPAAPEIPGDLVIVAGVDHGSIAFRLHPHAGEWESLPEPWRVSGAAVAREMLYPRAGVSEAEALYFPTKEDALEWLEEHPAGAVILTAALPDRAIGAAAAAGLRFPQKTTFFNPKPRAGLVLRPFVA